MLSLAVLACVFLELCPEHTTATAYVDCAYDWLGVARARCRILQQNIGLSKLKLFTFGPIPSPRNRLRWEGTRLTVLSIFLAVFHVLWRF